MTNLLDYREDKFFHQFFTNPSNEDALCSFLGTLTERESPFVSATIDLSQENACFRRDNSVVYLFQCQTKEGDLFEVSVVLGMGISMIDPFRESFLRMVLGNAIEQRLQEKPLHLGSLMLLYPHHQMSDSPHESAVMLAPKMTEKDEIYLNKQKFHVYSLERFRFTNPQAIQELWLTFLKDPTNELLVKHPMLPPEVKKAMDFAKDYV